MDSSKLLRQSDGGENDGEDIAKHLEKISDFLTNKLQPYSRCRYLYNKNEGYIVWRVGTGENVELLHLRTFVKRKGYGRKLVYGMLESLKEKPPYHSVFGFTRTSNLEAQEFYGALGFNLQEIDGLYRDGQAIMFWKEYSQLVKERDDYLQNSQD